MQLTNSRQCLLWIQFTVTTSLDQGQHYSQNLDNVLHNDLPLLVIVEQEYNYIRDKYNFKISRFLHSRIHFYLTYANPYIDLLLFLSIMSGKIFLCKC